jgi:hypothetical protein
MYQCTLCRWTIELDDVQLGAVGGSACICLRCYARETGTSKPMPKPLRRELLAFLAELDAAYPQTGDAA